jgi:hypothetical protein
MKPKLFFSILIMAFVFAFFAPVSLTKKVNVAGKALYGNEGYAVNRKKNSRLSPPALVSGERKKDCTAPPDRPEHITGPAAMCAGGTYTFTASPVNGAATYEWELPIGWAGSTTTNVMTAIAGEAGGDILVKASNECGDSETKHFTAMLNSSPVMPIITTDGTDLMSSATEGNQWYFESNPIKDATERTYTPSTAGKYHVCVTNRNSCVSCSKIIEPAELTITSEAAEGEPDDGLIFPNPSTGIFSIRCENCDDFIIYDSKGELILSRKMDQEEVEIDLTWRPKGPYWVEFHYGNKAITRKILIN